jgi:uncharacterized RDD family membrane protein YckC
LPKGEPTPAPARPRPALEGHTVYVAGFWHRFVAVTVDAIAVLPITALLTYVTGKIAGIGLPHARRTGIDYWIDLALAGDPGLWGSLGLAIAIVALYLFLFQAGLGGTPGMRLLRLRVIDVYGDPPGLVRSAIRTLGYVASAATLGLGFVWIAFDREKRGLHDWVAGTYVIRVNPPRKRETRMKAKAQAQA